MEGSRPLNTATSRILTKLEELGTPYHELLGIELESGKSGEIFKWFLVSILFGARISEEIAMRTYRELEREGLLSPKKIIARGWSKLVESLDRGGYVRYDFSTARELLEACELLLRKYGGDLNRLHREARDPRELEERIMEFKGVGKTTANIFLRELRGVWEKASPPLQEVSLQAAVNLGLTKQTDPLKAFEELSALGLNVRSEIGLSKLGRHYCRRGRCRDCPLRTSCRLFKRIEKKQRR